VSASFNPNHNGKEGVAGSSPAEGFRKPRYNAVFSFPERPDDHFRALPSERGQPWPSHARLREVLGDRDRWHAVRGHLHELGGDLSAAATSYVEVARRATNVAERDHLVRQAARARAGELFS
jgi:hypothetical protein